VIKPTDKDIGRAVRYQPRYRVMEDGVITSFNDSYVFVRYGLDKHSQATRREELSWVNGNGTGNDTT
jgi:hypothetical protein